MKALSPKVYVPALGQVLVGVVLLLLGLDVEGKTAIATGLGTLVVGFQASPGQNYLTDVGLLDQEIDGPASDELLGKDVLAGLEPDSDPDVGAKRP